MECGAFLIDLLSAFENYLAQGVNEFITRRAGWVAQIHPTIGLGAFILRPNVLLR